MFVTLIEIQNQNKFTKCKLKCKLIIMFWQKLSCICTMPSAHLWSVHLSARLSSPTTCLHSEQSQNLCLHSILWPYLALARTHHFFPPTISSSVYSFLKRFSYLQLLTSQSHKSFLSPGLKQNFSSKTLLLSLPWESHFIQANEFTGNYSISS